MPSEFFANYRVEFLASSLDYILAKFISKIPFLVCKSGKGTLINRSNLPGRKSAESIMSNLLVAPTTITYDLASTPSISFNN